MHKEILQQLSTSDRVHIRTSYYNGQNKPSLSPTTFSACILHLFHPLVSYWTELQQRLLMKDLKYVQTVYFVNAFYFIHQCLTNSFQFLVCEKLHMLIGECN